MTVTQGVFVGWGSFYYGASLVEPLGFSNFGFWWKNAWIRPVNYSGWSGASHQLGLPALVTLHGD